jgi:hypothetical protein
MKRVFFFIFAIVFIGCKEFVTSDFPEYDRKIVVNSILETGKPLSVFVSLAGKIDSFPLSYVGNAKIDLFVDDKFCEQLEYNEGGIYRSQRFIESEKEYKCYVIIPNKDTIICRQIIPLPNPIISVEHINIAGRDEEGAIYHAFKITLRNNVYERNYFEVSTNAGSFRPFDDPVLLNEGLQIALFSNEIIRDSIYTVVFNFFSGYYHYNNGKRILKPYIVELRSVTFDYYRYKKQYYLYSEGSWADGLTKLPTVFPLYSNIENANGIFAGYSIFTSDTIIPEPYDE